MPYLSAGEIKSPRRCREIYSQKDIGVLLLPAPDRADRSEAFREYSRLTENVKIESFFFLGFQAWSINNESDARIMRQRYGVDRALCPNTRVYTVQP